MFVRNGSAVRQTRPHLNKDLRGLAARNRPFSVNHRHGDTGDSFGLRFVAEIIDLLLELVRVDEVNALQNIDVIPSRTSRMVTYLLLGHHPRTLSNLSQNFRVLDILAVTEVDLVQRAQDRELKLLAAEFVSFHG
jgi:hypothetical protein